MLPNFMIKMKYLSWVLTAGKVLGHLAYVAGQEIGIEVYGACGVINIHNIPHRIDVYALEQVAVLEHGAVLPDRIPLP